MSGNDMPTVSGTDYGIWRRLLIIHWAVTIPPEQQRPFGEMLAMFDEERSGILNWLIEGVKRYMAHGLTPYIPVSVTQFTDDYREERDPVGTFAAACVIASPGSKVNAGDMYAAYERWCGANGIKPYQQTAFGRRMNSLGFKKKRGSHVDYLDVALGDVPDKFDPRTPGDPRPEPPPHTIL
jgi:putative DNA primase/helicase